MRRDGRSRDTIKSDIINNIGDDEKTVCGSAFGLQRRPGSRRGVTKKQGCMNNGILLNNGRSW